MITPDQKPPSKLLRGIAITLMGITVALTLLGAVGTTCVAFAAENYGSMAALVPYKPLYQALVVVSLAVGLWGVVVTVSLVRGGPNAFRNTLLVLVLGALSAGIQTAVSQSVRGSSAPVNVRFYVTLFTLVIFLLLRLPPLWARVGFSRLGRGDGASAASDAAASDAAAPAAAMLIACSAVTLTTSLWAGPSHTPASGTNWVDVLHAPLLVAGWGLMAGGVLLLLLAALRPAPWWPAPRRARLRSGPQPSPAGE